MYNELSADLWDRIILTHGSEKCTENFVNVHKITHYTSVLVTKCEKEIFPVKVTCNRIINKLNPIYPFISIYTCLGWGVTYLKIAQHWEAGG